MPSREWRAANPERAKEINRRAVKKYNKESRDKRRAANKRWTDANYEHRRSGRLQRLYGLTADQWAQKFVAQGSCCAICRVTETEGRGWNTDHCHETGEIRDILCHKCNLLVGFIEKNHGKLPHVYAYIERHK